MIHPCHSLCVNGVLLECLSLFKMDCERVRLADDQFFILVVKMVCCKMLARSQQLSHKAFWLNTYIVSHTIFRSHNYTYRNVLFISAAPAAAATTDAAAANFIAATTITPCPLPYILPLLLYVCLRLIHNNTVVSCYIYVYMIINKKNNTYVPLSVTMSCLSYAV